MKKSIPSKDYLCRLAIAAGKIILSHFQANEKINWKADETPVTLADEEVNKLILLQFWKDFPNISVVSEEGSSIINNSEYVLLCDPQDGTIPFIAGIPISAVSMALMKEYDPIISVIYDPFMKRLWVGEKGKPSTLNGKEISVSRSYSIKQSNLCIPWWRGSSHNLSAVAEIATKTGAFCINPAAVSYFGGLLAMGCFDGIVFPSEKYWEAIAIKLLVEGAGGLTTDLFGEKLVYDPVNPMKGFISSNGLLHNALFNMVTDCR